MVDDELASRVTLRVFAGGLGTALVGLPAFVRAAPKSAYRATLDRYASAGVFDGIATVVQGDRVLFREAAGLADREQRHAHRVDETFRIASVTKQFTAVLAMQEVERGSLVLDAPISVYLASLRPEIGAITTRQLLKNISGLPNLDTIPDAYTRSDFTPADLTGYLRLLPLTPLVAPPGTKFIYNNLDFIAIGAILESITRRSFHALVRERIVDKLGLRATGIYADNPNDAPVKGYEDSAGQLVPERIGKLANFGPAGAMYSTLDDLARWDRALLENSLIGADATREMFSGDRAFGFVGLGSWSYPLSFTGIPADVMLVERQGNIGGIQILNVLAPQRNLAMIVMANTDHANLFSLYARKGLPFDLLSLALRESA